MSSSESHFDAFREDRNDRPNFIDDAAKSIEQPLFQEDHPQGNGRPLTPLEAARFEVLVSKFNRMSGDHALAMPFDESSAPKRDREKLRNTPAEENE